MAKNDVNFTILSLTELERILLIVTCIITQGEYPCPWVQVCVIVYNYALSQETDSCSTFEFKIPCYILNCLLPFIEYNRHTFHDAFVSRIVRLHAW